MLVGAIIVVTILVIGSVLLLAWPLIQRKIDEKRFHIAMGRRIYAIARDSDFYLLNNIVLEIDDKKVHYDHILFGNKYIYCIGDAYYGGPLSGKYNDKQWFNYSDSLKFKHVKNPLALHKMRLKYLSSEIGESGELDLLVGIICVNDSCFLDEIPGVPKQEYICKESNLKKIIAKKEKDDVPDINPVSLNNLVHVIYNKTKK